MNVYKVGVDLTRYRYSQWKNTEAGLALSEQLDKDTRLRPAWTPPTIRFYSNTKKLPVSSFSYLEWTSAIVATQEAVDFLGKYKKCFEVLPVVGPDKTPDLFLIHVFSREIVPRGHDHSTFLGDFVTALDEELCDQYPICRDRIFRSIDGKAVPGVYKYCTDEFKDDYEQSGLTGLEFEPFWPLDDRSIFLRDRIRDDAAAEARGEMLKGNTGKSSPLPTGNFSEPVVSWKQGAQPTPEQLAAYLWQDVIDRRMTGDWLGDAVSCNTGDRKGTITDLAAQAVTHLLDSGVDRNVLCHLARSICYESINRTFVTFEETGIKWPGGKPDWESLVIALVQNATIDKKGRCGGWPPK